MVSALGGYFFLYKLINSMSKTRNIITMDICSIGFTPFQKVGDTEQPPPFLTAILSFTLVFGKILAGEFFLVGNFNTFLA